jgi:hypothetical protein
MYACMLPTDSEGRKNVPKIHLNSKSFINSIKFGKLLIGNKFLSKKKWSTFVQKCTKSNVSFLNLVGFRQHKKKEQAKINIFFFVFFFLLYHQQNEF